jgi:hypothetical protein
MALPKITVPLFDVTIPSTQKDAKFRPFLVKEEKILLIAQAGGTRKEMVNALKQIINNCVSLNDGSDFDADDLTTFDLEYLFVKIRAKSVDNVVTLKYIDHEDEKTYEFKIKLDEIEIKKDEVHTNKIKVNDEVGIIMRYPTASIITKLEDDEMSTAEMTSILIRECIDKIYDADQVYVAKESSKAELDEFIDSLSVKAFEEIQKYFDTMPKLYHKIEYTNSKGTARSIELTTLDDFFTLG